MGFGDKLKQMGDKAKEAAAERREQISEAVENAAVLADQKTHGKYTDKIAKATEKTEAYVERLTAQETARPDAVAKQPLEPDPETASDR